MDKIMALLGKNMLFIGVGASVVAAIAYVGATGRDVTPVLPNNTAEKSPITITKTDSTYVNTQWNDAVGGSAGMPENWPKDAPVAYPGATLMSVLSKDLGTGKPDPSAIYFTEASGAEVIAYYVKGLEQNGWKIEANADSAGYRVITAKKDTRAYFAFISVGPDGKTGVTSGVTF